MLTNRQIIDRIPSKELAKKMKSLKSIPGFEYIDWESWLKSTDSEFTYIGNMCRFKPYDETFAPSNCLTGIAVDIQMIASVKHYLIISNGVMYKIPNNRVEFIV